MTVLTDEIVVREELIPDLYKWKDNNKNLVRSHQDLIFPATIKMSGIEILFTHNEDREPIILFPYKVTCLFNNEVFMEFVYNRTSKEYLITMEPTIDLNGTPDEHVEECMTLYASLMAYMEHNEQKVAVKEIRSRDRSQKKVKGKKKKGTVYLTKKVYDVKEAIDISATKRDYTPPEHSYEVRGHWRTSKHGKRFWVNGFEKNKGKPKEPRKYKF